VFNLTAVGEETREPRSLKIKPSVLRKAHHRAIESEESLGEWVERAIEERIAREETGTEPGVVFLNALVFKKLWGLCKLPRNAWQCGGGVV